MHGEEYTENNKKEKMSFSSRNLSFFSRSPQRGSGFSGNLALQLQNAFSKPLPYRCYEVDDIIRNASTKDLRTSLPMLVESIFAFVSDMGWDLGRISQSYNPVEFDVMRQFLAPEGPILQMISLLQADIYLVYEFPIGCLPLSTRQMIEEGTVPGFYGNKVQISNMGTPMITLGALEYYLFHFAYYLINPAHHQQSAHQSWTNSQDYLYPALVDDYLAYFLPIDRNPFPAAMQPPALSPARSPVMHSSLIGKSSPINLSGGHTPQSPISPPRLTLFRANLSLNQKAHVTMATSSSAATHDGMEAQMWRSEAFVQILVEMWLNQGGAGSEALNHTSSSSVNSPHYSPAQYSPQRVWGAKLATMTSPGHWHSVHSLFETFMPTSNHMRVMRIFIKRLHYFSNSAPSTVVQSLYQESTLTPLEEFKRCVIPQLVRRKLYAFLKHAFEKWPLDSSFRVVLEVWLSYLQPWRYIDIHHDNSRDKEHDHRDRIVDNTWYPFIMENLLFYTVIFQEFVMRVYRMDLTSPMSAYMLMRVTKAFSHRNLGNMISNAEQSMCDPYYQVQDIAGSYLSHDQSAVITSLSSQIADLEASNFQYQPLFADITQRQLQQLVYQLVNARQAVLATKAAVTAARRRRWTDFFSLAWLLNDGSIPEYGDLTAAEMKKLEVHLNVSLRHLNSIFHTPIPEVEQPTQQIVTSMSCSVNSSIMGESSLPDHVETEDGIQLTTLGRYQVINGIRRFDASCHSDPANQPIRSHENATLVRLLYQLCAFINYQYKPQIMSLYHRTNMVGRLSKVYFAPPLNPEHAVTCPLSREEIHKLTSPRVCLRFLASYSNLVKLMILYLVAHYLLGTGPVGFVFLVLLLVITTGLFRVLTNSWKRQL